MVTAAATRRMISESTVPMEEAAKVLMIPKKDSGEDGAPDAPQPAHHGDDQGGNRQFEACRDRDRGHQGAGHRHQCGQDPGEDQDEAEHLLRIDADQARPLLVFDHRSDRPPERGLAEEEEQARLARRG